MRSARTRIPLSGCGRCMTGSSRAPVLPRERPATSPPTPPRGPMCARSAKLPNRGAVPLSMLRTRDNFVGLAQNHRRHHASRSRREPSPGAGCPRPGPRSHGRSRQVHRDGPPGQGGQHGGGQPVGAQGTRRDARRCPGHRAGGQGTRAPEAHGRVRIARLRPGGQRLGGGRAARAQTRGLQSRGAVEVGHERPHRRRHGLPRLHRRRADQEVQRVEVRGDDERHLPGRERVRRVDRLRHHLVPPSGRRGRPGVLRRAPRRRIRHTRDEDISQRSAPEGSAPVQDLGRETRGHRVHHRLRSHRGQGRTVRARRRTRGRRPERVRQPFPRLSHQEAVALPQRRG